MAEDTELLLALLSSKLNGSILSQELLLYALIDAGGDVDKAAAVLSEKKPSMSSKATKRKGVNKLDGWVVNKRKATTSHPPSTWHPEVNGATKEPILILSEDEEGEVPPKQGVANPSKPTVPLMSVLKQAPTSSKAPVKLPVRMLGTPGLVAQHTPCTMHYSILPSELACRLFYVMLKEAVGWSRNKWWLFDRLVESPHRTSFYARNTSNMRDTGMYEEATYWYNGRPTAPPLPFLPEMEEACTIVEKMVNEEISKRIRYRSEWAGPWRANVAASNCYTGSKETVGYHSDGLTYLGPCPTIASLSLGTTRKFRLREVIPQSEKDERSAQTFDIPVVHNSLIIMHASCQERFKHTIPPQSTIDTFHPPFPPPNLDDEMADPTTSRINITFRFYRPDFSASTIPRCHCGIPTILRPDMKKRKWSSADKYEEVSSMRYFWMCFAGAQNEGKGCRFFQVLDMETENRSARYGKTTY